MDMPDSTEGKGRGIIDNRGFKHFLKNKTHPRPHVFIYFSSLPLQRWLAGCDLCLCMGSYLVEPLKGYSSLVPYIFFCILLLTSFNCVANNNNNLFSDCVFISCV